MQKIDEMVADIQKQIYNSMEQEVPSKKIAEMVMEKLLALDEVAYVRFVSVYRQFQDVASFMKELEKLTSTLPKK